MGRPLRILFVTDAPPAGDPVLLALRQGGLEPLCERVGSAAALRSALAARPWDAVVSDYTLNAFDAPAALRIVRAADPDLPFIVVAGAVGEDAAVALMRATASDYVLTHHLAWLAPTLEREVRKSGELRAARAAAQAAAHLAAVVQSSDDAILSKTLDGTVTSWNAAAERLYGWTAAEAVGRHVSFLVPADKAGELAANMARLRAGEPVGYLETVRLHRDGHRLDVAMTMSRVRDADGRLVGVAKTARDIRDRKGAEDALRASEARLRTILDRIPDPLFIYDRETLRYLTVNDAAVAAYGYTRDEFLGMTIADIRPPEDVPALIVMLSRSQGAFENRGAWRHRRKDGTVIAVEITAHALDVDGRPATIVLARDVTERNQAEADLRRATDLLRAVADGTPDAMFVKDRAGRYLLFNEAAARFVGKPAAEVIGHDDTALFPPADARRVMDRDRRVMETERAETEEEVLTSAGATRTYLATKAPYRDAAGNVIGVFGVSRNIDDQKAAADALTLSERRYRRLFEAAQDGVLLVDPGTRRVFDANPFMTTLLGYARDELIGKELWEIGLFHDIEANKAAFHTLQEHGYIRYDDRPLATKDGRDIEVEFVSNVYADGDALVVQCNIRDVTERKKSEKAVRAGEQRLRLFVENVSAPVAMLDREMRYLHVSRRWKIDYRLGESDLTGLSHYDVFPELPPSWKAIHQRCLAGAIDRCDEAHFDRADGTVQWLSWDIRPWVLVGGEIGGIIMFTEDITARKVSEDGLRASEERYRTLVAATAAIVWDSPASGAFDSDQPSWTAFTGQTRAQHQQWGWVDAVHPDDREMSAAAWRAAVRDRSTYQVEHRLRRADGAYRLMAARAVPLRNADGAIREWIGVHVDVTDQRRVEVERADLLARLTLQIERMPLGYLLSDAEFKYTRWNPAAERIFGFERSEVLGRHPFEVIVPPQSQPLVAGIFARLVSGDMDSNGVCENLTKDGRTIACEWYNTPLFAADGSFQGILSLAQDVTDRLKAEQALHLRDRAIQAATQGLVITDPNQPDDPLVYVSPGFERISGYRADEMLGRNCRFMQGKDTDPATVGRLREAIRAGEACTVELLNSRKDGTPFWNELSISPVRDETGRLTHFVGVQADVTARRNLEQQFHHAQKMEAVGQLAAGVAHDFNNLLTIINGYSEMLLHTLSASDPARDLIGEIHKAGERAAGLTRQLLVFSRQQVIAHRLLDLNEVVAETEKMLRRLIGEDIRLRTSLQPELWAVLADAGQVEQVLMNLAVNARDAMPQGGQLTIETRNVELDESYARTHSDAQPGPHVLVSVTDTGSGMTPEVQARVFEPFYTTKGAGKGTGLGLATVYGIVKQSGGHVAISSEVGVGTTFKVYLPQAERGTARAKSHPNLQTVPRGTETILLVEDEAGVRTLARRILDGAGYTVLEAADGDEAARVAAGYGGPIDLLVTDVVMPGAGGRAVAERVAQRHAGVRVLFMSGYTDDAVIRHGILREGVNFIQKPFSPAALAFKVREVLDAPALGKDR